MAGELPFILRDQAPLGKLFMLVTLYEETANFVAAKFKPVHVVCHVEVEVVRFRVLFEEVDLGEEVGVAFGGFCGVGDLGADHAIASAQTELRLRLFICRMALLFLLRRTLFQLMIYRLSLAIAPLMTVQCLP